MFRRVLVAAAIAVSCAFPAAAASRLFSEEAPLKLTITGPFPQLVQAAKSSTNPYKAQLTVTEGAKAPVSMPIQLRARGLTRRTAGYCSFPPLSLVFDKAAAKGSLFSGEGRLKLVTYCRPASDYEQRVIIEHLAYKIYNLLTPMSFRVRAADVTDRTSETDKGTTRFGFLIEDADDMADRNQRQVLKIKTHGVGVGQLDQHAAARAAIFEFFLGNLDWEFLAAPEGEDCCHNARLLGAKGVAPAAARGVTPVPYDFDYSGFVDSPYAGPHESVPIENLKERYYRGYCQSSGEVASVLAEFKAKRAAIEAVISGEARLSEGFRKKTLRFIDDFYDMIDDPGKVDRNIVRHCR